MAGQSLEFHVDIVLCIDATGSMRGLIDKVKQNALSFHTDLTKALGKQHINVSTVRIKVIAFRDYYCDTNPMLISDFFTLPKDITQFESFVNAIEADGGGDSDGDEPANGLEALALAMKSPWTKGGSKRYHVIVLWTDASAHKLEDSQTKEIINKGAYPANLPKSFDELSDLWHDQFTHSKTLLIYAPDIYPWNDICNFFDDTIHVASKAGTRVEEYYDEILESIIYNSL